MTETETPKFNHVAMTLPVGSLDEAGRAEILEFYGDVFGWQELPQMTEDGRQLVLMAYEFGQFVFLTTGKRPMEAPPSDHFGMAVSTMAELDAFLDKCKAWQAKDDRVRIVDKHVDDFGVLKLTAFYVQHLLPLMVEVQHFDWQAEVTPAAAP